MKLTYIIPFALLLLSNEQTEPASVPPPRHKFTVICHRGDHTQYPENTIESYAQAIKDDADYLEIDLRTTSDGKLVSMHDASVNRMTDGKGQVKDFTLSQIENLRVKSRQTGDTVNYRVPTFEQILKLCKDKIYIYIDFKEADVAATLRILKQYQMQKQVLVYINKPSQYTDWRKADPNVPLMLSLPDTVKSTASMKAFMEKYRPDVLDGDYDGYTTNMLNYAASLHVPVWPDGQNPTEGPSEWDKAIATGLKGLQTDNPQALIKYLTEKGLR